MLCVETDRGNLRDDGNMSMCAVLHWLPSCTPCAWSAVRQRGEVTRAAVRVSVECRAGSRSRATTAVSGTTATAACARTA